MMKTPMPGLPKSDDEWSSDDYVPTPDHVVQMLMHTAMVELGGQWTIPIAAVTLKKTGNAEWTLVDRHGVLPDKRSMQDGMLRRTKLVIQAMGGRAVGF